MKFEYNTILGIHLTNIEQLGTPDAFLYWKLLNPIFIHEREIKWIRRNSSYKNLLQVFSRNPIGMTTEPSPLSISFTELLAASKESITVLPQNQK